MATRYETRWYVTTDRDYSRELAAIDKTPENEVRATDGVTIVHHSGHWTYWSDGKLTKPASWPGPWDKDVYEARLGGSLSKAACEIFSAAQGSDSGLTIDARVIASIATVTETTLARGPHRGVYARAQVRRLDCVMVDGAEKTLWLSTVGYFEGYEYELSEEEPGNEGQ